MAMTFRTLAVVCAGIFSTSADAQQSYTEILLDNTEIPAICSNLKNLSARYQETVKSWETVQKNLTKCTSANCKKETVEGYKRDANRLDRHRILLEQRLAIEERSYVGAVAQRLETKDDELFFVLGEDFDLGDVDLTYVSSPFPIYVVDDEERHVGEVRSRRFASGGDLRLLLRVSRGNRGAQSLFYYSLAGPVGEICSTLEDNNGLILEFGITYPSEGQTPLGLDLVFRTVTFPELVGKQSTVNHFLTVGPIFEAFFSLLPHRKEKAEEYRWRSICSSWRSSRWKLEDDLFTAVGSIRGALAEAVGGGDWPTERQLFANSKIIFGKDQEEQVTIELVWNNKAIATVAIVNTYDREDWPYTFSQWVSSIHQNGKQIYGCVDTHL